MDNTINRSPPAPGAAETRTLADIRAYANERHRADEIRRNGLHDVLAHFGMPDYQPRIKVQFRITGCYELDSHIEDEVRDAATTTRMSICTASTGWCTPATSTPSRSPASRT